MAYLQSYFNVNLICIFMLTVFEIKVFGDKIEESIYRKISGISPCVTLLNATHQIGCTSKRKGNVGVVHYIDSDEQFKWLLNKGNHAPYIPLFTAELFTDDRLKQLINADKVSGALVLFDRQQEINGTKPPSSGFSPANPCPNENFGLYGSEDEYSCHKNGSKSIVWNDNGSDMSYKSYDVPVFALYKENEIDFLIKCYKDHNKPSVNGENPDYPLCGVELLSFMFAAKDTPTCMRKNNAPTFTKTAFCDALGDENIWGTLFPLITQNDIVLATAKLDSTAFFHDIAPGADNDVTGIVVLLAAAEVLGDLKRNNVASQPKGNQKHIMFSFFHGEAWDYIGSSRMVYDMINDAFPCYDETKCVLKHVGLSNISDYLELNQVGLMDTLWAHRDPKSDSHTKNIFKTLSKFGASVNLTIKDPSDVELQPLPPASFQSFLKEKRDISGLVITDHNASFTNKFYNSRFDDIVSQNFDLQYRDSSIVQHLTRLSTTVAKTLYNLAYNETKEDMKANEQTVHDLLHCLLITQNCSLFQKVVTEKKAKNLASHHGPMNRYVGPYEKQGFPSGISRITKYLLAYFTRIPMNLTTCESETGDVNIFVYEPNNDSCIGAHVYSSPAKSPAFENEDYDSTKYSTWTESRWGSDTGIRMFLIADPTQEAITLAVGIVLTFIALVVTVFMYRKAEQLFSPDDRVLMINNDSM
ncbi:nicastrin-like [Dendronephthya gigantea]|uniref:nicastrin-like n=1 Tax=Dendronephthya gigantea TaxID=151771 RepID=UPI0010698C54|nr:nicastrin-like [Dendronephthya gigantea]